ncbi:hypothetical protein UFOVP49_2 [uncultured Caudovirales phage]|uniref:Uncharacterized protein n=1 Tax=uncultured Caudovirales phage TaxID=2100421 RepID=A0A6J5KV61_9CAUD|nr:hypothetical protein UFOVP49_2 [uncultured Caudovirales phage]
MKITVSKNNPIGKVNFAKVAKSGDVGIRDLYDVHAAGQQDGDILIYHSNTSSYYVETLKLDGGIF